MKGVAMAGRYWLFAVSQYHPAGGMGDLHRTADSIEEAVAFTDGMWSCDYFTLVDSQERKMADLEREWHGDACRLSDPQWEDIT